MAFNKRVTLKKHVITDKDTPNLNTSSNSSTNTNISDNVSLNNDNVSQQIDMVCKDTMGLTDTNFFSFYCNRKVFDDFQKLEDLCVR